MLSRLPFLNFLKTIDWILLSAVLLISAAGLVTMNSFIDGDYFFDRQVIYLCVSLGLMFFLSLVDFRFLRRTSVIMTLYLGSCLLLILLFIVGSVYNGAQQWFNLGFFSFQVSEPVKLVIILLLAKYFTRRHVEIAHIRHIIVSGFYTLVVFVLVFLQPDFGSSMIIFFIWFGMVLVSGISKKHVLAVFMLGLIAFVGIWFYAFDDYQKQRVKTFVNPLSDIQGSGYHAYQSTIAVGSGQIFGKGIGYGTQSKLHFLPEYETDFIFAAFAEEWGFVGVVLLFILYGIVIWRILANALYGATNFEILFCSGLAILLTTHFAFHVGINVGVLPVTGTTIPFMSYGGSHLFTEFIGLGILMGMRRYQRIVHRDVIGESQDVMT